MSNRLNQKKEAILEPRRVQSCAKALEGMGYDVEVCSKNLKFTHNGHTITMFPYSGWFSGKGIQDGRGFKNLLRQLKEHHD